MARTILAGMVLTGIVLSGGCGGETFSKSVWDPFNVRPLFFGGAKPVRIGIVAEQEKASVLNPVSWLRLGRTPWMSLENKLSGQLQRPVVVENLKPFQIAAHLKSGRIQFAWLPAADYLELVKDGDLGKVLVLSQGGQRRGLIITSARSKIATVAEIKQRRFAFGPKDDPVLHRGALQALENGGVSQDDLAREVLPVPGSLQYHISSQEAAKEVIYGLDIGDLRTAAGVIEETEYMSYPETGGRLLPLPRFSKDQFRILARTEPVRVRTIADGPVLAGDDTDAELVATMTEFMLAASQKHKRVLRDLGVAKFHAPPRSSLARLAKLRELAADQTPAKQPG